MVDNDKDMKWFWVITRDELMGHVEKWINGHSLNFTDEEVSKISSIYPSDKVELCTHKDQIKITPGNLRYVDTHNFHIMIHKDDDEYYYVVIWIKGSTALIMRCDAFEGLQKCLWELQFNIDKIL